MQKMSISTQPFNGNRIRLQRQRELRAVIEQKGEPTFFFTFSCADNHWADLHDHMPERPATRSQRVSAAVENSHIVDTYFSMRLEALMKRFMDQMLDADWHWHRFEWQSRTAIHAHGVVKLKNYPGLVDLATKAYIGMLAQQRIDSGRETCAQELNQLIEAKRVGDMSKKRVLSYAETLISCWNIRDASQFNPVVPDPHPASKRPPSDLQDTTAFNDDLEELANCVQRHVCRPNGYCYSRKHDGCRFSFPQERRSESELVFEQSSSGEVTAKLLLKRNDEFMNPHLPAILPFWRANMDIQIVVDTDACIRYLVKYATKAEKESRNMSALFKQMISNSDPLQTRVKSLFRSIMMRSV